MQIRDIQKQLICCLAQGWQGFCVEAFSLDANRISRKAASKATGVRRAML